MNECDREIEEIERTGILLGLERDVRQLLPKHNRECTFENFVIEKDWPRKVQQQTRAAVECIKAWQPDPYIYTLIISGVLGLGKSHLAAAKVREFIMSRRFSKVSWFDATDIYADYAAAYRENSETNPADIRLLLEEPELLVIDDLGRKKESEASVEFWNGLICFRYREAKPLIITTNLTLDQIKEQYGYRIYSRFIETAEIVELVGEDYRKRIAQGRA